eukprot:ctg_2440.g376
MLPLPCQPHDTSPWLDRTLFSYDESKLWSADGAHPATCSEYPAVRLVLRRSGAFRWKLNPEGRSGLPTGSAAGIAADVSQPPPPRPSSRTSPPPRSHSRRSRRYRPLECGAHDSIQTFAKRVAHHRGAQAVERIARGALHIRLAVNALQYAREVAGVHRGGQHKSQPGGRLQVVQLIGGSGVGAQQRSGGAQSRVGIPGSVRRLGRQGGSAFFHRRPAVTQLFHGKQQAEHISLILQRVHTGSRPVPFAITQAGALPIEQVIGRSHRVRDGGVRDGRALEVDCANEGEPVRGDVLSAVHPRRHPAWRKPFPPADVTRPLRHPSHRGFRLCRPAPQLGRWRAPASRVHGAAVDRRDRGLWKLRAIPGQGVCAMRAQGHRLLAQRLHGRRSTARLRVRARLGPGAGSVPRGRAVAGDVDPLYRERHPKNAGRQARRLPGGGRIEREDVRARSAAAVYAAADRSAGHASHVRPRVWQALLARPAVRVRAGLRYGGDVLRRPRPLRRQHPVHHPHHRTHAGRVGYPLHPDQHQGFRVAVGGGGDHGARLVRAVLRAVPIQPQRPRGAGEDAASAGKREAEAGGV